MRYEVIYPEYIFLLTSETINKNYATEYEYINTNVLFKRLSSLKTIFYINHVFYLERSIGFFLPTALDSTLNYT